MATRTPLILNQVTARVEELSVGDIIPGTFVEGYTGKNALINGDFSIWQRGTNFTAPGYTADRWTFNAGGVASPNVWRNTMTPQQFPGVNAPALARVSYGAITDAAAHFVVFEQLIEDVSTFAAETVSMQFTSITAERQGDRFPWSSGRASASAVPPPSTASGSRSSHWLRA